MTTEPTTPRAWANFLAKAWGRHFPVDVRLIASDYSRRFVDPIQQIAVADVPSFEGALFPLKKKGGWAILYNSHIPSAGRMNYTLGHEFGHYLCHRHIEPAGFQCGQSDILGGTKEQEREADLFASYLLMPLDDYREQVGREAMTLDLLRHCADRYGVSFTAAALKWLECTPLPAAVVVAVNGFVLWCRRSGAGKRARLWFPSGMEVPPKSVAASGVFASAPGGVELPAGVWSANRAVRETAIFADKYEMTISLLVFDELDYIPLDWLEEETEDTLDRFTRTTRG